MASQFPTTPGADADSEATINQFMAHEAADQEAGDLEHMACLFEAWWSANLEGRGFTGNACKLSLSEFNLLGFMARNLMERSKRVSRIVGDLPR